MYEKLIFFSVERAIFHSSPPEAKTTDKILTISERLIRHLIKLKVWINAKQFFFKFEIFFQFV